MTCPTGTRKQTGDQKKDVTHSGFAASNIMRHSRTDGIDDGNHDIGGQDQRSAGR